MFSGTTYLKESPLLAGEPELGALRFPRLGVQELAEVKDRNVAGALGKNGVRVDIRLDVPFNFIGRQLVGSGRRQSLDVPDGIVVPTFNQLLWLALPPLGASTSISS
jgi:hypothetical protein